MSVTHLGGGKSSKHQACHNQVLFNNIYLKTSDQMDSPRPCDHSLSVVPEGGRRITKKKR